MIDKELKSYKRIHSCSNPSDVEKAKIKKETDHCLKHRKSSEKLTKELLRKVRQSSHIDESLSRKSK